MSLGPVEIVGQIADLKEVDYKNTLALSALIELLIDKGLFTRNEFACKAFELEHASIREIVQTRQKNRLSTVVPMPEREAVK